MALATYAELKAAVASWLNRDDLTSQIPDFIALFEADFDADVRTVRHRRRICRSEAEISNEYETLATNYLAIQSVEFNTDPRWRLDNRSPEQLVNMKQDEDTWKDALADQFGSDPAPPKYFAIVGTEIRFFPEPEDTYTALMTVYERLDQLADASDTNWCLTTYPQAYLYGALLQAAPYLADDERIAVWQGLYDLAIQKIETSDPLPNDPNVERLDTPPPRQFTSASTFRP